MKCDFCDNEATHIGDDAPRHSRRLYVFCEVHYSIFISAYSSEAARRVDKSDAARMIKDVCGFIVPLRTKKGQALLTRRLVVELKQGDVYDW